MRKSINQQLIQGNKAIVIGALAAGATYFSGYPITPASEIMTEWAKETTKNKKLKFLQTEDEIAAIHSIIGASMAGAKAFTATSGPGFSLIQEGIGFAYVTQTPLVIVNSQRQGPSTGMPTIAAQGDILQTQYGTHGDHMAIVFYPYSAEECFKYTIEAFNAAEESLSPVILLLDGYISLSIETTSLNYKNNTRIVKRTKKALGKGIGHFTGLVNINGIPKTRSVEAYKNWLSNIQTKILSTAKKYNFYEYIGNKKSDTLLVAFGAPAKILSDQKYLNKFALFRPIRMFPPLEKEIKQAALNHKKIAVVEMNEGQYALMLKGIIRDKEIISIPIRGGDLSEIDRAIFKLL